MTSKKEPEEKSEDLELEVDEEELKGVSGGLIGLRRSRSLGARLKKVGKRDHRIAGLRHGGRTRKKV